MSYKQFIKDVAVIGFTQILINLSGFILLPIISKTLGVYKYGIWAQLIVTITLLTTLASLGLYMAFIRFFSSKNDKKEISKGFFSIFFFLLIFSLIISSIFFISSEQISLFLFNTEIYSSLIKLTSFIILLNPIYIFVLYFFRTYRKMLIYSGLTFFSSIIQITLIVVLLLFFRYGLYGVIFSTLFSYFIPLIIGLGIIIKQIGFSLPSFKNLPKYLRFSLPLTPSSLIYWITDSSDRYVINFLLGINSVGIYSAAYLIGYVIGIFVLPLQMILFPQLSKLYDNKEIEDVKKYISYSIKFFLMISLPSVVGLSILSKQILLLLTTAEFTDGTQIVPLIALSFLFAGIYQIIINIIFLFKKTKNIFLIQVSSALLNIVLNFIFIPIIGIIGAAFATLFSFFLMFIISYFISIKYLTFKIDIIFIIKIILSSIIMGLIILFLKEKIDLILIILFGFVIYSILCYIFKIFNKQEKLFFKNLIRFSKNSK